MSEKPTVDKPLKVTHALIFLYVALAIRLCLSIAKVPAIAEEGGFPLVLVLCVMLLFYVPVWFLIFMMGKGKNWARITYLVFFILGFLEVILETLQSTSHGMPTSGVYMVTGFLNLWALVLLFQREASAWFRKSNNVEKQSVQQNNSHQSASKHKIFTQTESRDSPLFVLKYEASRRLLLIIPSFLLTAYSVHGLLILTPNSRPFGLYFMLEELGWVILFLVAALPLGELLLFSEIRLYTDRIVKVWRLLGSNEIALRNASFEGSAAIPGRMRRVTIRHSGRFFAALKSISYAELLANPKDVKEFNSQMASVSGRTLQEFERPSIDLRKFISEQE